MTEREEMIDMVAGQFEESAKRNTMFKEVLRLYKWGIGRPCKPIETMDQLNDRLEDIREFLSGSRAILLLGTESFISVWYFGQIYAYCNDAMKTEFETQLVDILKNIYPDEINKIPAFIEGIKFYGKIQTGDWTDEQWYDLLIRVRAVTSINPDTTGKLLTDAYNENHTGADIVTAAWFKYFKNSSIMENESERLKYDSIMTSVVHEMVKSLGLDPNSIANEYIQRILTA